MCCVDLTVSTQELAHAVECGAAFVVDLDEINVEIKDQLEKGWRVVSVFPLVHDGTTSTGEPISIVAVLLEKEEPPEHDPSVWVDDMHTDALVTLTLCDLSRTYHRRLLRSLPIQLRERSTVFPAGIGGTPAERHLEDHHLYANTIVGLTIEECMASEDEEFVKMCLRFFWSDGDRLASDSPKPPPPQVPDRLISGLTQLREHYLEQSNRLTELLAESTD